MLATRASKAYFIHEKSPRTCREQGCPDPGTASPSGCRRVAVPKADTLTETETETVQEGYSVRIFAPWGDPVEQRW